MSCGLSELLRAFGSNQIKGHDLLSTDPIYIYIYIYITDHKFRQYPQGKKHKALTSLHIHIY